MASLSKRVRKVVDRTGKTRWVESDCYYIHYRNSSRKIKRIKCYPDKVASGQMLARFEKERARGREGLSDPFEIHNKRPLMEHVGEFLAEKREQGCDDMYVYNLEKRLNILADECKWGYLPDVSAESFTKWRAIQDEQERGPVTLNQFRETMLAFLNWAERKERIERNPLRNVEGVRANTKRRVRRALSEGEIAALLNKCKREHSLVYRLALTTGLRRQELEDLQWRDLRLEGEKPSYLLRAEATKSRRADSNEVRKDLAVELIGVRPSDFKPADAVFPHVPTIDELKADLELAGIRYKSEDGRYADFHSLRHTFGTFVAKYGTPAQAMKLMRHTDPRLTMNVYCDGSQLDLARVINQLPQVMACGGQLDSPQGTISHTLIPDLIPQPSDNPVISGEGMELGVGSNPSPPA